MEGHQSHHHIKPKAEKDFLSNDEKNLISQLEKNLLILEQDFTSMLIKIQKGMNQVPNTKYFFSNFLKKK